jgi:endoglucanase
MRLCSALLVVTCAVAPEAYAQIEAAAQQPEGALVQGEAAAAAAEVGPVKPKNGPQQPASWWSEKRLRGVTYSLNARKLPRIQVSGNRFVDERGRPMLFRGLSISDPDKIQAQGQWNKKLFERIREMGATLVRIPVHPVAWRTRTPEGYMLLLDQAVEWATDSELHLVIDWHSIGNLKTGLFQDRIYETTMAETYAFWRTVSGRFAGHNTVAFYELFNEPTTFGGQLGRLSWQEWKAINEDLIVLIRARDRDAIPLVAGLDWAYDLTPLRDSPIQAERIGYVTHPYPHKRTPPWEPKWDEDFGFAAERYPIIATEMGYMSRGASAEGKAYGPAIVTYLEGKGISWLAWVLDPDWMPNMIESWKTFKLTENGQFFRDAMQQPTQ